MSEVSKKRYVELYKEIVLGITEVDQEFAILDEIYREQSYKAVEARLKEVHATVIALKEKLDNHRLNYYSQTKK